MMAIEHAERWRDLNYPEILTRPVIDEQVEAGLLEVGVLGPVDVGNGTSTSPSFQSMCAAPGCRTPRGSEQLCSSDG